MEGAHKDHQVHLLGGIRLQAAYFHTGAVMWLSRILLQIHLHLKNPRCIAQCTALPDPIAGAEGHDGAWRPFHEALVEAVILQGTGQLRNASIKGDVKITVSSL